MAVRPHTGSNAFERRNVGDRRLRTAPQAVMVKTNRSTPPLLTQVVALALPPSSPSFPIALESPPVFSDEFVPFSWIQAFINTFAYAWLLTNFLRTDMAIHNMDQYHTIEPNVYVNFGPYAYAGSTFYKWSDNNVTSPKAVALWSYKYDTTSLAMRAFADYLNVSAFPKCVLYKSECDADFKIAPAAGYSMVDSLVYAIQNASTLALTSKHSTSQLGPQTLLLRASYMFYDRIHHYLAPQLFTSQLTRTCHALHYSSSVLASAIASVVNGSSQWPPSQGISGTQMMMPNVCSLTYNGVRPYFCDDLWTNFRRSCNPAKPKCVAVDHISTHIMSRIAKLTAANPNATIDMTIIEGIKDSVMHRGGVVYVTKQASDVITIFRVRTCTANRSCDTRTIEEYRYEGEIFTTDILAWYTIVIVLRGAAQTYYCLRLVMLYLGCYYAVAARRGRTSQNGFFTRIRHTTVMFLKIPSQVVIYGSAFPLTCYLIAHIIDAPIVYELTAQKFDSFHGLFNLTFMKFVTICSVQMRNVWVLAAMARVIVRISTQHDDWSPLNGVWSVPQFSIVVISSFTILAQFRFISLRYTPITSIERIDVFSRLHPILNELLNENGGGGKESLGGVFIDIKAACCSALMLFMFAGIVSVVLQCFYPRRRMKLVVGWSHSITSLSAGILWPTSALAVSWNDDLFKFDRLEAILRQHRSVCSLFTTATPSVMPCSFRAHKTSNAMTMITTTLESRPRFAESITYLMNITVLTDPITFLCWRWNFSRNQIGYYRARKFPHREYLVPILHGEPCIELNWEALSLARIKSADELAWFEIIQCG